jgi:hypothetical protein
MPVCPRCRAIGDQGRFIAGGGVCRDCYRLVLAGIARFRRRSRRGRRPELAAASLPAARRASLSHSRLIPPGGFGLDHCPFAAGEIAMPGLSDVPDALRPALICPLG